MNDIGYNIKRLREKSKMSVEAVADKLDVSDKEVLRWESGGDRADVKTLGKIAKILDADIADIIYGSKEREVGSKKRLIVFIIFAIITIIMMAASFILQNVVNDMCTALQSYTPAIIYMGIWTPALYIFTVMFVMSAVTWWSVRVRSKLVKQVIFIVSALFLLIYIIFFVLVFSDSNLFAQIMMGSPILFALPGLGIYLALKK